MVQPINYMIDMASPTQAVMDALKIQEGRGILDSQQIARQQQMQNMQYQQEDQGMKRQQFQTGLEADQAAQIQARKMQIDLNALAENPSAAAIGQMMVKYPQLADKLQHGNKAISEIEKDAKVTQASQVYAALNAGEPEVAKGLISRQIQANRNVGKEEEAKALETLLETVERSPEAAKTTTGMYLAATMGADKFTETFTKLQGEQRNAKLADSELTKKQAEARSAAVRADFAESMAVKDLEKKGWDIWKLQEDAKIARENTRIAALRAELAKTDNVVKEVAVKQKIEEAQQKREEKLRERTAEVRNAKANIDNLLNTADRVLNTPMSVIDNATGAVSSRLPTFRNDSADFEALIETMNAQAFMSQIPNMASMGALSDGEGEKLSASLQNLSLRQSPQRLMENVRETQRLMLKARKNLSDKYGVPNTGIGRPDTPAAQVNEDELESLLRKYGG